MKVERVFFVVNVSLVLISVLLVLNLFDVSLPTVGKVSYTLDSSQEECLLEWDGEFTPLNDIDRCCLEARKQLSCGKVDEKWLCKTGESTVKFWLNNKAYNYCRQQRIWR